MRSYSSTLLLSSFISSCCCFIISCSLLISFSHESCDIVDAILLFRKSWIASFRLREGSGVPNLSTGVSKLSSKPIITLVFSCVSLQFSCIQDLCFSLPICLSITAFLLVIDAPHSHVNFWVFIFFLFLLQCKKVFVQYKNFWTKKMQNIIKTKIFQNNFSMSDFRYPFFFLSA